MFPFQRRKSRTGDEPNGIHDHSRSHSPYKPATWVTKPTSSFRMLNVLLVGQIYQDTILYLDDYPAQDTKTRATGMEQRLGGNICNTAQVLSQFPGVHPSVMSCLGPKATSRSMVAKLENLGITTTPCLYRKCPIPSSYILQSGNTRTIISCNTTTDMTKEEFACQVDGVYSWVHFENSWNVLDQMDWLETKAMREGWRSELTISVELEKPDRPDSDVLCGKGDVVFFSKGFAQSRHYRHPKDFLLSIQSKCKPGATLFCTWGENGATCLMASGEVIHASAIPIHKVIDSVGAGDTFIAGIIFCLGRNLSTLTALKFACEMASRKVEQHGFGGLAKTMWKLWQASLDVATSQSIRK